MANITIVHACIIHACTIAIVQVHSPLGGRHVLSSSSVPGPFRSRLVVTPRIAPKGFREHFDSSSNLSIELANQRADRVLCQQRIKRARSAREDSSIYIYI